MKLKKILLIALALSSMFITINVSAVESKTTKKSFANITEEEFKKILPAAFNVSFTKSEYVSAIYEAELKEDETRLNALNLEAVEAELQKQLEKIVKENGYSPIEKNGNETYSLYVNLDPATEDIVFIDLFKDTEESIIPQRDMYETTVKINYAKEPNYNEQDTAYVKKAVAGLKLNTYNDGYCSFVTYDNLNDILHTFATDEELKNKILPYDNLLDDKSITVKPTSTAYSDKSEDDMDLDDEYLTYYDMSLNFYKNDVLYETKKVRVGTMYGVTLDNGTAVNIKPIEKSDKTYTEMVSKLKKDGYNTAINGYELKAYGSTTKGMKFTLDVDKKYNDENVVILHKKANGTYETLKGNVKDGKVTITVDELSPFMIALDDRTIVTKILNQKSIAIAIVVILLLLVILVVKSKKKAA